MLHGVLNVYKEKGWTSHDVVAKLRRITGQKKIGHTGTLDPEAQGVLPVCFGKGTKLCDMLTDKDKEYEAVLLLGVTTDTQDMTGEILAVRDTADLQEEDAAGTIRSFVGEYDQIPPMYSALKVNGKKLYELARSGQEIERKPRRVQIREIEILEMELPRVRMRVTCSKGTYIRTLCQDIGEKLGCGGCMESLTRTRVERFSVEDSIRLSEAEQRMEEGSLASFLFSIDEMFDRMPKLYLKPDAARMARSGNSFLPEDILWAAAERDGELLKEYTDGERVRVYDEERRFIAIYEWCLKEDRYKLVRMFFDKLS